MGATQVMPEERAFGALLGPKSVLNLQAFIASGHWDEVIEHRRGWREESCRP